MKLPNGYGSITKLSGNRRKPWIPFSESEINKLWSMADNWDVKVLLILLYSGMRVNELLKNNQENVNLEERWIYVPGELV
mgnify:FL=1